MRKTLFFFLFIFGLQSPSWSLNLGQLIKRSRQYIGQTSYQTPLPTLSDTAVKSLLNEGQKYASAYTWMLVRRTTFSLLAGTTEYYPPSDFQTVKKLWRDGVPLPESTLDGLDSNMTNWGLPQGTPNTYYVRLTTTSVIGFVPWPNSSVVPILITMDYIVTVVDMVNLSDVPYNGSPDFSSLHESLAKYVAYRYYLGVGQKELADIWGKEFLADISILKSIPEKKPNYRPGFQVEIGGQRQ